MSENERRPNEPLWRQEFPIHQTDERYVTRRQFTKFLTLTSLGMFAGQAWILGRSWTRRPAGPLPAVLVARDSEIPVGASKQFHYPDSLHPCLLIRLGEDDYVAFEQKCTHLSCAVVYVAESGWLECPCHEGFFSARDGMVLQGPPPRPLPRIRLERRDGALLAVGVDGVDGEG